MEVNTVIETKNGDFFENIFPWKTNGQQQVQRNLRIESSDPSKLELRRSKRERKETNLGDDFYTFLVDDNPRSYKEAMTSSDAPLWKEAINGEIESIMITILGRYYTCLLVLKLWVVNGSLKGN